jgi:hypothetical protein
MKRVCAWCGKPMGEKDGRGQSGTSHGICPACEARLHGELDGRHVKIADASRIFRAQRGVHLVPGDLEGTTLEEVSAFLPAETFGEFLAINRIHPYEEVIR